MLGGYPLRLLDLDRLQEAFCCAFGDANRFAADTHSVQLAAVNPVVDRLPGHFEELGKLHDAVVSLFHDWHYTLYFTVLSRHYT